MENAVVILYNGCNSAVEKSYAFLAIGFGWQILLDAGTIDENTIDFVGRNLVFDTKQESDNVVNCYIHGWVLQ